MGRWGQGWRTGVGAASALVLPSSEHSLGHSCHGQHPQTQRGSAASSQEKLQDQELPPFTPHSHSPFAAGTQP